MTLHSRSLKNWPPILALLAVGLFYFVGVARILGRWWFIDDPGQYDAVSTIPNSLRFFVDLSYERQFGSGHGVVPIQMLSYWIDVHLPFAEPLTAYVHNLLVALAALLAIFFVLRRVLRDDWLCFAGAIVWLLLPSTLATCIFISTRHYVEGLVFAAIVFCIVSSRKTLRTSAWFGLIAASVAGMLSKEIYAGLIPAMLLIYSVIRRDRALGGTGVLLALLYAVYRTIAVGASMTYVMPLLGLGGYLKYLLTLPYTFTATLLAYPLVLVVLVGTNRYLRNGGEAARQEGVIFAILYAVTLFMVFPIAYAVVNSYRAPGPWYRSSFLPNTIVLVWLCLLVKKSIPARRSLGVMAVVGVAVLPGTVRGLQWWNENMRKEETEARFCLRYPNRLLYTDDPTYWYLSSVQRLYRAPAFHVLYGIRPDPSNDFSEARRFGQVWSYRDGVIQVDPARTASYLLGRVPEVDP